MLACSSTVMMMGERGDCLLRWDVDTPTSPPQSHPLRFPNERPQALPFPLQAAGET